MWLILAALAIGLVYASLLYLFSKKYSKPLTVLLFTLRTIAVAVAVMLCFNPYIKQKTQKIEQPIVILAEDNSASITMTKDSLFYKEKYPEILDSIKGRLDKDYDVVTYPFGNQYTNIAEALSTISRQYYKKNVGAVVLLSDGIVNQGVNPELNIDNYPFTIYTVTLGDTVSYPSMTIKDVQYNKTVQANMLFPLRVTVNANNYKGDDIDVTVTMDGVEVAGAKAHVTSNRYSKTFDFNVDSGNEGTKQINILLNKVSSRRVFINVTDKKYRILCLAKAPHPDIAAIRSALDNHFEFEVRYGEDIDNINDYDLVILHQFNANALLEESLQIPSLSIIGSATDFDAFNQAHRNLSIKRGAANTNLDIRARYNNNFGLFTIGSDIKNEIKSYPPLSLPHLETVFNGRHDDLLMMNIMDLETPTPVIAFTTNDGIKQAFFFGTGCWRWKLYEYFHHKNNDGFNELLSKTVKYLLTEQDKELTINHKDSYITTEVISLTAELRNPSRELVNEPDLHITITRRNDANNVSKYDYVFARGENNYNLKIGMLPEGIYNYHARTSLGGIDYNAKGTFSVEAIGAEAQDLTANIERMRSIASQTGGNHYYISDIRQIINDLNNDERITSISREETRYDDLINIKWLFVMILGIITLEWLLRKVFGVY